MLHLGVGRDGWLGPQGLKTFPDALLVLCKVLADLLETVGALAGRPVVQARSEVSQRPAPLLLKPEQDYLHFTFPKRQS